MEIEWRINGKNYIVVDTSIRDKLKRYRVKGETYEDIIVKLMKFYDATGKGYKPSKA